MFKNFTLAPVLLIATILTAAPAMAIEVLEFDRLRLDSESHQPNLQRKLIAIENDWFQIVYFTNALYSAPGKFDIRFKHCWIAYRTGESFAADPEAIYSAVRYCNSEEPDRYLIPSPLENEIYRRFYSSVPR